MRRERRARYRVEHPRSERACVGECGRPFTGRPDRIVCSGIVDGFGNSSSVEIVIGGRGPAWRSLVFRAAGAIIGSVPHARKDPCAVGSCS